MNWEEVATKEKLKGIGEEVTEDLIMIEKGTTKLANKGLGQDELQVVNKREE